MQRKESIPERQAEKRLYKYECGRLDFGFSI